ncbi:MAG: L,D-transpeptidase [Deltaproteobacteria bacterium]|nr:MAG: L,D-transpeptidase [Deltaproteobacteria bacterium]
MSTDDQKHWTGSRIVGLQGQELPPPQKPRRRRWWLWVPLGLILLALTAFAGVVAYGWHLGNRHVDSQAEISVKDDKGKPVAPDKLAAANDKLRKKLAALAPKGQYVVIDTANNRVYLRDGDRTLREMVASCGSGNVLVDPVGGRTWTFDTPRGQFQVKSKVNNPVWIKPDWAFIEEGEPIPKDPRERADANVMGDYALGIGNGYFIHGTLYKRLLGRNVSHGCVRLGDEDLEFLFKTAVLGTKVIIY